MGHVRQTHCVDLDSLSDRMVLDLGSLTVRMWGNLVWERPLLANCSFGQRSSHPTTQKKIGQKRNWPKEELAKKRIGQKRNWPKEGITTWLHCST